MTTKQIIIDGISGIWTSDGHTPTPTPEKSSRWARALHSLEHTHPTGAWGKSNGGRQASEADVTYNRNRVSDEYIQDVIEVASSHKLPPELMLGIFDRESNHGRSLDSNGRGDNGHAFGCGQVDFRYHEPRGIPDPLSPEHMHQCCEILLGYIADVAARHSTWDDKYVLKGGVVAYNSGPKNVQTIQNMDTGTTGNDYGADVCARAQFWKEHL